MFFFFFKQKTAYEIKECDWSSDVCSSDLFLASPDQLPESIRTAVMRNAGGDYNHAFFWSVMKKDGGGEPNGQLAIAIKKYFGDFDAFKKQFCATAKDRKSVV